MKTFTEFWPAYEGLASAKANLLAVPKDTINASREDDWYSRRRSIIEGMDATDEVLRNWLKKEFPKTCKDALLIDAVPLKDFFAKLKKYPELARENQGALMCLLKDVESFPLDQLNLKRVPDIEEFLK